jgi:hypothetical protein
MSEWQPGASHLRLTNVLVMAASKITPYGPPVSSPRLVVPQKKRAHARCSFRLSPRASTSDRCGSAAARVLSFWGPPILRVHDRHCTTSHVFGELFRILTGVEWVHVPYRSSFFPDLLAGQVHVSFTVTGSLAHLSRHLHSCSGCFRLERSPGGSCTHRKAPHSHGARQERTSSHLLPSSSAGQLYSAGIVRIDPGDCTL